jgi:hypothetical protein
MNQDANAGLVIVVFLTCAIIANETQAPLLAIIALVVMPIVAVIVGHISEEKPKR